MKPDFFAALKNAEEFWRARIAAADISSHPTTRGNVLENAWVDLFQKTLPTRYKVSPGFVVSAHNEISEQIDCVVYDDTYTPVLFREHGALHIPAEAVHAVFEIKPHADKRYVLEAAEKVESVRSLHCTSGFYIVDGKRKEPKPLLRIIGGLLARRRETQQFSLYHEECSKEQCLNLVLTSENGGVDCFDRGYRAGVNAADAEVYGRDGGLMKGVFRLIRALQWQGTVPAINMEYWLSTMDNDDS